MIGRILIITGVGVYDTVDMYTEGESRRWILKFPLVDIANYVNAHTVIESKRNPDLSTENILTNEDRDFLLSSLQGAVSNVAMMLSRRMERPQQIEDDYIVFTLTVGENHDDNMSNILYLRILNYLQQYALYRWNGGDVSLLRPLEDEIRSAIHYRKHSVARQVRNLL